MTPGAVKLSVKPVFIGWITLLMQLPLQLFFTVWAGGFFGGMGAAAGLFAKNSWTASYAIGAIVFFAFPIIAYVGKKLNYSRTEYRFYYDRLEVEAEVFSLD